MVSVVEGNLQPVNGLIEVGPAVQDIQRCTTFTGADSLKDRQSGPGIWVLCDLSTERKIGRVRPEGPKKAGFFRHQ